MADATLPELEVLYILSGYQWRSGVNDVNRCSSIIGFRGERTGSMIPEALRLASDSPEVSEHQLGLFTRSSSFHFNSNSESSK